MTNLGGDLRSSGRIKSKQPCYCPFLPLFLPSTGFDNLRSTRLLLAPAVAFFPSGLVPSDCHLLNMQFSTLSLVALVAPHFIIAAVIPRFQHEAPLLPRAPAKIAPREPTPNPLAYAAMEAEIAEREIRRDAESSIENRILDGYAPSQGKRRAVDPESYAFESRSEPERHYKRYNRHIEPRESSVEPEYNPSITKRQLDEEEIGLSPREAQALGPIGLGAGMGAVGPSAVGVGFDKREITDAVPGFSRRDAEALRLFDLRARMSDASGLTEFEW